MPEIKSNPWLDKEYRKHSFTLEEPGLTVEDIPERLGLLNADDVRNIIGAAIFTDLADTPDDYGEVNKFARTDGDGNISWSYPFWKPSGNSIYFRNRVAIGHSVPRTDCHLAKADTSCKFRVGAKQNPWVEWETTDENVGFSAGIADSSKKLFKINYDSPIGTASQLFACFDAGNNRIGAFVAAPVCRYHIRLAECSDYAGVVADTVLLLENDDNVILHMQGATNGIAQIRFVDDVYVSCPGAIEYDFSNDWIQFTAGTGAHFYVKSGYVTTENGSELAVGNFGTPTNPFHVQDEGSVGGWSNSAYGGVVARFRHSGNKHTSVCIDAQSSYDAALVFSVGGAAVWDIRNDDSDTNTFNLRYQAGVSSANRIALKVSNTSVFSVMGASGTDSVQIYHDETDGYIRTLDGSLIVQTDEGSNTRTYFAIKGKGTGGAELQLWDSGASHCVGFSAPALTATQIWVLPNADGPANEVLGTDNSGNLIWRTHNEIAGLQGGTSAEYYHLTSSEHTELNAWLDDVTLSDGGGVNLGSGAFVTTGTLAANTTTITSTSSSPLRVTSSLSGCWIPFTGAGETGYFGITAGNIFLQPATDKHILFYDDTTARMTMADGGNLGLMQFTFGTNAIGVFAIGNETAPTTSPADCFQMYSADIGAGEAAAHLRTEHGDIIKLYQQAHIADAETSHTVADTGETCDRSDIDAKLDALGTKINAIYTALENNGLLASA